MVQWDFYIFKRTEDSTKASWVTVGHNPAKGSGTYEESVHVVPGRAAGAGWLPALSLEDYETQFAGDLPTQVSEMINDAFERAHPVQPAKILHTSEPEQVREVIVEIRIRIT